MLGGLYELTDAELEEVMSGFTIDSPNYSYTVGLTEISDPLWRDHPWRRCEFDRNASWSVFKYYLAIPAPMRSVKRAYVHYQIAEKGVDPEVAASKSPSYIVYNDSKAVTEDGIDLRDYNYMPWAERAKAWDKFKNTLEQENVVAKRRHVAIQEFEQIETLRQHWFNLTYYSMKNFEEAVKEAQAEGKRISETLLNKHITMTKRLAETHNIFTADQRGSVQMPTTYTHTQTNETPEDIFKWREPDANDKAVELEEMIDRLQGAVRSGKIEEYTQAKDDEEEHATNED